MPADSHQILANPGASSIQRVVAHETADPTPGWVQGRGLREIVDPRALGWSGGRGRETALIAVDDPAVRSAAATEAYHGLASPCRCGQMADEHAIHGCTGGR